MSLRGSNGYNGNGMSELKRKLTPVSLMTADFVSRHIWKNDAKTDSKMIDLHRVKIHNRQKTLSLIQGNEMGLCTSRHASQILLKIKNEFIKNEETSLTKEFEETLSSKYMDDTGMRCIETEMSLFEKRRRDYQKEPSPKEISLKNPERWFEDARGMQRAIVYHYGPTNSGKTHAALEQVRLSSNTCHASVYFEI